MSSYCTEMRKSICKSCQAAPRQGQAEKLSKSRKKFLSTTYQDFFSALYMFSALLWPVENIVKVVDHFSVQKAVASGSASLPWDVSFPQHEQVRTFRPKRQGWGVLEKRKTVAGVGAAIRSHSPPRVNEQNLSLFSYFVSFHLLPTLFTMFSP